jgi:hypothetical protein
MKSLIKSMLPKKKVSNDDNDFDWREEGISSLVRIIVLAWTGAILTLNYVHIPGISQQKIDPTFIASIFTGTLATFGVTPSKSNGANSSNGNGNGNAVQNVSKTKEEQDKNVN